jgi:hypothetical protein
MINLHRPNNSNSGDPGGFNNAVSYSFLTDYFQDQEGDWEDWD